MMPLVDARAHDIPLNEDEEFEKLTQQEHKIRNTHSQMTQILTEASQSRQQPMNPATSSQTAKTTPAKVFHSQLKKHWSAKKDEYRIGGVGHGQESYLP